MYEIIISGGDSFTFGAESVDDTLMTPSQMSWANLVAEKIGKQHINTAKSGRSNSFIARQVLYQLSKALEQDIDPGKIFVQVMWTFTNRHEVALGREISEYDSPWAWITPYSHANETLSSWFLNLDKKTTHYQCVKENLRERYIKNKKYGIVDYASSYHRLTAGNTLNDCYITVKEILLLQNFLKLSNVNYLFSVVDKHARTGIFRDSSVGLGSDYINMYREMFDLSKWFFFPDADGFCDWAKKNNYEFATSHPLEQAHKDAASLIYNYIISKGIINEIG